MNEKEKCIKFLNANGWVFSYSEKDIDEDGKEDYYDKPDCLTVGIDDEHITFFDDTGDIYYCDINVYTLLDIYFIIHKYLTIITTGDKNI